MQLNNSTIADVTYYALLDIQQLLDRLDCNIIANDGGASADVSETVQDLVALHCLASGKTPIDVLKDVYPRSEQAEYEAFVFMIKEAFELGVRAFASDEGFNADNQPE